MDLCHLCLPLLLSRTRFQPVSSGIVGIVSGYRSSSVKLAEWSLTRGPDFLHQLLWNVQWSIGMWEILRADLLMLLISLIYELQGARVSKLYCKQTAFCSILLKTAFCNALAFRNRVEDVPRDPDEILRSTSQFYPSIQNPECPNHCWLIPHLQIQQFRESYHQKAFESLLSQQ